MTNWSAPQAFRDDRLDAHVEPLSFLLVHRLEARPVDPGLRSAACRHTCHVLGYM
jgi:hypothetical protein